MDNYLFSGLKVLDVATVIAAPAAAMMLADFGAEAVSYTHLTLPTNREV